MRFLSILLACILGLSSMRAMSLSQECESALESLFESEVTKDEAGEFLQLQGEITLHRLAWTYLKAQKNDSDERVQTVQATITELLNEKYTNANPDFVKAREAYEAQPLSRTALADIAPYLKEALAETYTEEEQSFKLNISDLKLLAAIARQERATAVNGHYDHRMLDSTAPQGMLNFVKLINSGYKTSVTQHEEDLQIQVKLSGLENVMANMQKRLGDFLNQMEVPTECKNEENCTEEDLAGFFKDSEAVQKIFWESLADKLESDDVLMEKLAYGDLWLKVKGAPYVVPQKSESSTVKNDPALTVETKSTTPSTSSTNTQTRPRVLKPRPREESFSPRVTKPDPRMKPAHPAIVQSAGMIIEDPAGIILRDHPGMDEKVVRSFDQKYKAAFAQAVLDNDKVFVVDGKLYERKSGKALVPEYALSFLPPSVQEKARDALAKADPKLKVGMVNAWVNGHQTFIHDGKLMNLNGTVQEPTQAIADVMSKKLGLTVSSSRYKGMDQNYLVARANALKNNEPYFTAGNKVYDSYTGYDLGSPARARTTNSDAKIDKNRRRIYENLSDSELIRNFTREHPNPDCGKYGIIDKKKGTLKVYENGGKELFSKEVLLGKKEGDERTRWIGYHEGPEGRNTTNLSTGAGILTIVPPTNDSFNKKHFNNNILSLTSETGSHTPVFAIHQVPVGMESRNLLFGKPASERRVSNGCANLKVSDFNELKGMLGPKCKVYVLPEEEGNKFVVRDNEIKFVSTKTVPANRTNLYNFSSNDTKPAKIDIKIVNPEGNTQQAREFVKALEDEKAKIMKLYGLSNDEYNDLAQLAYGIMGNESKFGQSAKLKGKEFSIMGINLGQGAVITGRWLAGRDDVFNTSRGLTQIKNLPAGAFTTQYPEINKDNLVNPRNSAVATMGYLAEAARTMRKIAIDNREDTSKLRITRENMMDYISYLYQGGGKKLTTSDRNKQATPELNQYYRGLQRNMSYIEISQKIE